MCRKVHFPNHIPVYTCISLIFMYMHTHHTHTLKEERRKDGGRCWTPWKKPKFCQWLFAVCAVFAKNSPCGKMWLGSEEAWRLNGFGGNSWWENTWLIIISHFHSLFCLFIYHRLFSIIVHVWVKKELEHTNSFIPCVTLERRRNNKA